MLEQFLNHIQRHNLCKTTDKILLAVSGGVDSMVMLHLFKQAGFSIAVAHCNYQLRGEASRADEALVNLTCVENGIPFHLEKFETEAYAKEKSLSIQMAARELRYEFFARLMTKHQYDKIATAHHLNDSFETVILNLTRGTGIDGLNGIAVRSGNIIRPLLFSNRDRILDYASFNRLRWREDESNAEDDYQRNFIRHHVVPKLKELNPNLEETFSKTQERIAGGSALAREFLKEIEIDAVEKKGEVWLIDKQKIAATISPSVVLWELIKDKDFNFDQCQNIMRGHQAGKKFLSSHYELFINADHFLIRKKIAADVSFRETIDQETLSISNGVVTITADLIDKKDFQLQTGTNIAQLDYHKLIYPLIWRRWKNGDSFSPLGMTQTKKVSDFLVDSKVPLSEKDNVSVIESNGRIVWLVGLRISDQFKVDKDTRQILCLQVSKN